MAILMAILLLAPEQAPESRVPEVVEHLEAGETSRAIELLREIGTHKGNDREALELVRMVRVSRDGELEPAILEATFLALKGIGSRKATRPLIRLIGHHRHEDNAQIRIGVLRALGGSADPAGVETIIDHLRDDDDRVIAAAADAASAHRYAPERTRKELFEDIMGIYVSTWNLKHSVDPNRKVEKDRAERRWEVVQASMERALQLLSNTTVDDPPAWRRWWNKNKNKRWAELDQ